MKLKFYLFFLCCSMQLNAQLFIDNAYTIDEMVMDFFDNSCVTPSNVTTTGTNESFAFFDAGGTSLGVPAGIFISTGNVLSAVGPNTQGGTGASMGIDGDDDLSNILGVSTFDGITIEMDIVATGTDLEFSYVFASEEYPEFVGSQFNDIFAFFVSGPGISGLENIAMIPGSSDPVAINTINGSINANFYVDNSNGQDIEFDGYTTEMTAQIQVVPSETYQVKIVVADAADAVFDSGIFLGIASLCGEEMLEPINISTVEVDGNTITFDNQTKYVSSHFWSFGDGMTSTEKIPAPHTYSADGIYEVQLITTNFCCSDTTTTFVEIGDVTSTSDIEKTPFTITPNPVKDLATITVENGAAFDFMVLDAHGKVVLQQTNNVQGALEFADLPNGLYFIQVQTGGEFYVEKMIKN